MARTKHSAALANYVSEWFGHRVYPDASAMANANSDQQSRRCPFLTSVTGQDRPCIKSPASLGVCTISSCSNGPRKDWLVCPYRALDAQLLEGTVRRLFRFDGRGPLLVLPAPTIANPAVQVQIADAIEQGHPVIVYLQDKLGGEIAIPGTERSPELALVITLAEIVRQSGALMVGRFGILEVQTMDYHGTYKHAVKNLTDALRLHADQFVQMVQANPAWLSEKIEGPNIANVFKRTFYQIVLKFQIALHDPCVGCVLALPAAVWDSWQRLLGRPEMTPRGDGTFALTHTTHVVEPKNWIVVFDVVPSATESPNGLRVARTIAADPDALVHFAFKVAGDAAIARAGGGGWLLARIQSRPAMFWPALAATGTAGGG